MIELVKPWDDAGQLYVKYEGSGNDYVEYSSDIAEGLDRKMTTSFIDKSKKIIVVKLVKQEGMRETFSEDFILADGGTFNVLKDEL